MTELELPYSANLLNELVRLQHWPYCMLFDSCKDSSADQPADVQGVDLLMAWPLHLWLADSQGRWQGQALIDQQTGYQTCELMAPEEWPTYASADTFEPGLAGAISYDFGLQKMGIHGHLTDTPKAIIGDFSWWICNDHQRQRCRLLMRDDCPQWMQQALKALLFEPTKAARSAHTSLMFKDPLGKAHYQQAFEQVQQYILAGDCYQINLTRPFEARHPQALDADHYRLLRQHTGAPFSAYFNAEGFSLFSVSPERFISIDETGEMQTKPIKGTIGRHHDGQLDAQRAEQLQNSEKDRAENLMIVDLLRNDLGKISTLGSVQVDKLFALESFKNVHHLVSTIRSQLKPGLSPLAALLSAFPGGSITGAPKKRAMEIIQQLEGYPRQYYCGSMFYLTRAGRLDSSILIRTLMQQGQSITGYAGGGVVFDSSMQGEWAESDVKIRRILEALGQLDG